MRLFKLSDTTFENFDKTVRNYLSKTFSTLGLQYTDSQVFGVIYTGIKGIMQNVMLYIEDAFTEQNIETASRKRSIYSLASLSGYEPYYGSAASGTIAITSKINSNSTGTSTKLYIKNHSSVIDDSTGMMYTIILPSNEYVIDLTRTLMKHRLKLVQGVWVKETFTAKGDSLESFPIGSTTQFDKQYIDVKVNGETYEQAACLYDMTEDEKKFVVKTSFDNLFELQFGNGVHGRHLAEGDVVETEYLIHDGQDGNILFPGSEKFKLMTAVYDASGSAATPNEYLKFAADGQISGGTNADTVKMVRNMVGWNSRSLVLASEENIKQFLNRFSFIGQTTVSSIPGTLNIEARCLSSAMDSVTEPSEYLELSPKDLLLTDEQKEMVINSLENSGRVMTGVSMIMEDPIIRQYACICYVKVSSSYTKNSASSGIKDALAKYFMSLPQNTTFIAKSDIISYVMSEVSGIESFDFDFISKAAENAYADGYWIKYVKKLVNGVWQYVPTKMLNDNSNLPGLDSYGNIQLDSDIELPILHGNFKYYPEKSYSRYRKDTLTIDTVTFVFI